jgi:excisionase family DNA binding protein
MSQPQAAPPPPLLCSIPSAARQIALSRSRIYELIAEGRIKAVKDGRRRLIVQSSLYAFVASLTDVSSKGWQ